MDEAALNLIFVGLFAVISLAAWGYQNSKLQNSEDFSVVFVAQLKGFAALEDGPVTCTLYRQSGNTYREMGEFDCWQDALDQVIKSFNRAKIDSVMVLQNSETTLELQRAFHSHGRKAEGKKLGGALIRRL